ncbi:AAA-like domain-containing protein [Calothrix sp. PCC 6303]|uniref:AAA-like domain-containing protein n=1 Tax=Calothrix sp. PCC 6303 TaxID=1170562 RepID=UPI0002A00352|nr:AAA-like domain-containing protein [Calothrix sp. PCC 6303]AFY99407.1 hypothetical protein Cal6303_0320 [Calothrix sp. PCC 6303]
MADFNLDAAIKMANYAVNTRFHRNLTDVEIMIIKGSWWRQEYDEIAAKNQYATTYISQDVAPKLWKILSDSLEEKVKKSNFKQALQRQWEKRLHDNNYCLQENDNLSQNQTGLDDIDVQIKQNLVSREKSDTSLNENINGNENIYVRRPEIENICDEVLAQPGSLIRIKAPSFMGKTMLMVQVMNRFATKGYRHVILSLELADRNTHFTQLNKFLRWFCSNVSRELGLPSDLDRYWDEEGMGAKVSCTTYFEQYLLVSGDTPLVLCLDNIDVLFPYPEIYEDFFGLLRSWYEKARSRPIWKKLRLVLVHSTDVYIRLNINQSPFNVGLPLEISEFNRNQVEELARQHRLELDVDIIDYLIQLVGGHPYLLDIAFSYLTNYPQQISWEQIVKEGTTETGIFAHHLREHWLNLQEHPELATALKAVIDNPNGVLLEPILAYHLQSMGLVKIVGNFAHIRCQLYRQYFRLRLGENK